MPEVTTQTQPPPEDSLWSKILSEASTNSSLFRTKNVLFLGDRDSGKTTLLSYFTKDMNREIGKGLALDYSYIDITADEDSDEPIARINSWILEGNTSLRHLLNFSLTPETLSESAVVITLDYSQPWSLVESLKKWLGLLAEFINKEIKPKNEQNFEHLQKLVVHHFQQYKEPTPGAVPRKKTLIRAQQDDVGPIELLPLDPGTLETNLGLPIFVVCCKTDSYENLEKDYGYNDSHFDYIQQYLRRICLNYGASLTYSAGKSGKNCDVLLNYIQHVLFKFDFASPPNIADKDSIFVPFGWDTFGKIKIDFDNQQLTNDPDLPFEEVIKKPANLRRILPTGVGAQIAAEDDQNFLSHHFENIRKEPIGTATPKKGLITSLREFSATPDDDSKSNASVTSILTGTNTSTKTPTRNKSPTRTSAVSSPATAASAQSGEQPARQRAETAEHQVLFNFFNTIINKDKPTAKPTAGPGGAAPASTSSASSASTSASSSTSAAALAAAVGKPSSLAKIDIEKELERLTKGKK